MVVVAVWVVTMLLAILAVRRLRIRPTLLVVVAVALAGIARRSLGRRCGCVGEDAEAQDQACGERCDYESFHLVSLSSVVSIRLAARSHLPQPLQEYR